MRNDDSISACLRRRHASGVLYCVRYRAALDGQPQTTVEVEQMAQLLFGRCMPCWSAEQARFEKPEPVEMRRPDEGSDDEEGGCTAYKAHTETTLSPAPRPVRLVSLTDSNVNLIQSLLADESQDRLRDRSDYEKKMDCWKSPPRTGRSCDQFDREVASSFSNSVVHQFPQLAGPCDL